MQRISLADDWHVYTRDDAFSLVTAIPDNAVRTSVPYDALFAEGQRADAPSGGATSYFDGGVYYYQRTLEVDEAWRGGRLVLKFDGVFSKSFVYVNGSLVGSGDFGYASLTCDIADYVRFGAPNDLLVVCKSDPFSSRWYGGTGILRPVWLLVGEAVHVEPDSLFVRTESLAAQGARIRVSAVLRNVAAMAQTVDITVRVADGAEVLVEQRYPVRVRDREAFDVRVFVPGVQPWSETHPKLYEITFTAGDDVTTLRTGFRTITVDPANGLLVNGEHVLLCGACIHHDEGILGGIASHAFERWRVGLLKEAGFNAVRSAHNHASAELLAACDELGVFVLDEVCDMWTKMKGFGDYTQYFQHSWRDVTSSLVREDRSHPSVIGYSTGNEISDINTEKGFETAHDLYELIRTLDPTRFVTNGVNGAFAAGEELVDIAVDITGRDRATFEDGDVNQFMGLMATQMAGIVTHPVVSRVLERLDASVDVQGYNYMTERYVRDAADHPNRVMLGTETNPRRFAENWGIITATPAVIGEFTWTGWDYIGELGTTPYPAWRNDAGDITLFGFRTPVSYWREIALGQRKLPFIAVRPPKTHGTPREFGPWRFTDARESWTWDVPAATPVTVEVYSADAEVELLVNGVSAGKAKTSECYALFEVAYEPGTLEAVGSSGARWSLATACGDAHVVYDDCELDDLVISRIHLEDEVGTWVFGDGRELNCTRDGLRLVAAGSEDSLPPFDDPTIRLVGQGALAIYRRVS